MAWSSNFPSTLPASPLQVFGTQSDFRLDPPLSLVPFPSHGPRVTYMADPDWPVEDYMERTKCIFCNVISSND